MKQKLLLLWIASLLLFSSCNEVITCIITSPAPTTLDEFVAFYENQSIFVSVDASTTKNTIRQVQLFVDEDVIFSTLTSPYNFTIPPGTIAPGLHILSAVAHSSGGNREVAAIYINIKEAK